MQRTNVYLTEEQARELNIRAAITKKPKATILREVIDKGLKTTPMQKSLSSQGFMKLGEIAEQFRGKITGPKDLSAHLDKYTWDE